MNKDNYDEIETEEENYNDLLETDDTTLLEEVEALLDEDIVSDNMEVQETSEVVINEEGSKENRYVVKTLSELEAMFDSELIDYVIEGETKKKSIQINRVHADWSLRLKRDLTLKNEGVNKLYNLDDKESGSFSFPYMDERKHPKYFDEKTGKPRLYQGKEKMTPKKYFRLVDTVLNENIFGLSTTETYCAMVPLKFNDFRYADIKKDLRTDGMIDEKFFYYDYQERVLVQVNRKKNVDDKTGKVKVDKDGNPVCEKTVELLRREKLVEYVLERFTEMEEDFVIEFDERWSEIKKISLDGTLNVQAFLGACKELLELSEENLKVKLVLSLLESDEYAKLKIAIRSVLELIATEEEKIKTLLKQLNVPAYVFKDDKVNKAQESIDYVRELGTFTDTSISGTLKKIVSIFLLRPEFKDRKEEKYTFDGYLDQTGIKIKKLYPNLSTINTRYFFTEHQSSDDKRAQYEERLINALNQNVNGDNSSEEAAELPVFKQIYTEQELQIIIEKWKDQKNRIQINFGYRKALKEYPNIKQENYPVLMSQFTNFLNAQN